MNKFIELEGLLKELVSKLEWKELHGKQIIEKEKEKERKREKKDAD